MMKFLVLKRIWFRVPFQGEESRRRYSVHVSVSGNYVQFCDLVLYSLIGTLGILKLWLIAFPIADEERPQNTDDNGGVD